MGRFIAGFLLVLAISVGMLAAAHAYTTLSPSLTPQAVSTTVASLPSCTTALRGSLYIVTDSLLPVALATVAGGGAVVVPVVCNGTAWIVS